MRKILIGIIFFILVSGLVSAAKRGDMATNALADDDRNDQNRNDVQAPAATATTLQAAQETAQVRVQQNQGQGLSDCMQELLKKQPNILREKAQAICNYRVHNMLTLANRAQQIESADVSEFVELQRGKIESSIEECPTEECKTRAQERLQRVERLNEAAQKRLQNIEQKRVRVLQDIASLQAKPEFLSYKMEGFRARVVNRNLLEAAKNNFLKAKQDYLQARKNYKESLLKFHEIKKKVQECKESETDECVSYKTEIITRTKEHLMNSVENILNHLNKLKSKVESSESVSSEEAGEIMAKIEEKIAAVGSIKNKIQVAETKDGLVDAAKELREILAKSKIKLKEYAARTVNARIGGIIAKSKQLQVRLERVLSRMTERGIDTTTTQQMVDEFNALIENARSNYELAVAKFKEAKAKETPDEKLIQEAQQYMKDAHKSLKDAQQKLKDITQSIREAGGESEINEAETEEDAAEGGE